MFLVSKFSIIKVIVPPLLACTLFVIALFGLVLPLSQRNLLDQKKETITLLTQAADGSVGEIPADLHDHDDSGNP